jgi:hypothetical protein
MIEARANGNCNGHAQTLPMPAAVPDQQRNDAAAFESMAHTLLTGLMRDGVGPGGCCATVTLFGFVLRIAIGRRKDSGVEDLLNDVEADVLDEAGAGAFKTTLRLTPQQRKILGFCNRLMPTTAKRIARALGKREVSSHLRNQLKRLVCVKALRRHDGGYLLTDRIEADGQADQGPTPQPDQQGEKDFAHYRFGSARNGDGKA